MIPKYVIKRNGEKEEICFDKIKKRLQVLCDGLNMNYVNLDDITRIVKNGISDSMTTEDIDHLSSMACEANITIHPDYSLLAGRVEMSNLQKKLPGTFSTSVEALYNATDVDIGEEFYQYVMKHRDVLDAAINYENDMNFNYMAFKTLECSYFLRTNEQVMETPQYLYMRVAVALWMDPSHDTPSEQILTTYKNLSNMDFTLATPTLFNSGLSRQQLASCFVMHMNDDSIDGIYKTLMDCAKVSKYAGGIGLSVHNIRSAESSIRGTNGKSNGLVPMLRVYNDTARYVDQGGGKRKGSFAIYLEPWHADIEDFLLLRRNFGKEERRARDLFYAMWIPDLFMERVKTPEGQWTLFDPKEVSDLIELYGDEFKERYEYYEKHAKSARQMDAQYLWNQILNSIKETGTPYMLFKDACNKKSNQKNLGTIKSSNLCTGKFSFVVCLVVCLANIFLCRDRAIHVEG